MPLSEEELLQVLEMFQKSGWQDMQLRSGSRSLVVSKSGRAPAAARPATASPAPALSTPQTAAAQPAAAVTVVASAAGERFDPNWTAVKAPMLGTFYAAPKPGAAPFVTVGQAVTADDTVGILEVMKLMNYLKAGVAGRIARLCVGNGDLAEFDQVLLYIEPLPEKTP
ncbi:acetyl-CoA carboxylase biotin carboxyl carrier protein [Panacagrimonas sp.]|uniref:acetyl-CoA carboxylase biotin carboxyl carrier protein n=1 Tax=Panacagrimonas sp. TaxID=2480088 RepID=UPI003B52ED39